MSGAPGGLWKVDARYSRVHGTVTAGGRSVVMMVLSAAFGRVVPSGQVRRVARTVSVAVRATRRLAARGHGHMADSVAAADLTR